MTKNRTDEEKLHLALELLKRSSSLYDKADRLLADIGVETIYSKRPIEFYLGDHTKSMFFIYKGVEKIAEIMDSCFVRVGHPYHDSVDERYHSFKVDDIDIYELEDDI